ncbi:glycosyltransferase family 2 protein [Loktanella agnita]|uniref:glycosyltransferase family 2 protein n=1 Tax=Loktanella agnita TaxID=287097 RepID=UPI0039857546
MNEAAIIIPHYNDPDRLRRCLSVLVPQVQDQPVEIVVVDNASTVDLSAIKTDFPRVRFLDQPEKGPGPARNLGVVQTTAPRLFFTDSDCVPAPDWVATALAISPTDKITGGPVNTFDEDPPPRSGAQAFETVFAFPFEDYVKRQKFTGTGNLITTRNVFEKTGLFAGGVFEDKDWCLRAGALGFPVVWHPGLIVSHPTRDDFAGLCRKWKSNVRVAYSRNGAGFRDRLRWGARALIVAGSGVLHLGKVARHPLLSRREKLAAGWTLLRLRSMRAVWMIGQLIRRPDMRPEGRLYDDA